MPEIEQQLAPGTPPTDYHAALSVPNVPQDYTLKHLTRSLRDFARISELTVGIVDSPLAMSGTEAFNSGIRCNCPGAISTSFPAQCPQRREELCAFR